jgi:hypothetical protein
VRTLKSLAQLSNVCYHLGAIYISTLAAQQLPEPNNPPINQHDFLALTIQPIVAFMVLCSVAIHGLSIPFSLLGRRVHSVSSRTWSRHAPPDWTTQLRHVTRAEDIIINRDPGALERGEGVLTEEEKSTMESKRASTITSGPPSPDVQEIGEGSSANTRTEAALEKDLEKEEEMKEEVPPDGTERTTEWREGQHKIIERRDGPGGEVCWSINSAENVADLLHRSMSRSSTMHSSPRREPRQYKQAVHIFASYTTPLKKSIAAQKRSRSPSSMISVL